MLMTPAAMKTPSPKDLQASKNSWFLPVLPLSHGHQLAEDDQNLHSSVPLNTRFAALLMTLAHDVAAGTAVHSVDVFH